MHPELKKILEHLARTSSNVLIWDGKVIDLGETDFDPSDDERSSDDDGTTEEK